MGGVAQIAFREQTPATMKSLVTEVYRNFAQGEAARAYQTLLQRNNEITAWSDDVPMRIGKFQSQGGQ